MSKRIVICSDGTWNKPDQKDGGVIRPSNVAKMAHAVLPRAPDQKQQVVFYDKGVGTGWGLDRLTGGAFGSGLTDNIEDAYRFLIHNYCEGDEIFMFGFSRGAYTVRSTAGLIRNCGILNKINADKFGDALKLYRSEIKPDDPEAEEFIAKYSRKVNIKFLGVWDTVGSLGIPLRGLRWLTRKKHQFHDVKLSGSIEGAFHALAIDEKRGPFKPTLWESKKRDGQAVKQVWFAGVHTNIGGGYKDSGLSDWAFLWMKEQAESCGLALDQNYISDKIHENNLGVLRNSRKGFYLLTSSYIRSIGKKINGYESVHDSANERYDQKEEYKPQNLTDYRNQ